MNTSHPTTTRANPDIRGDAGRTEKVVPINPMQSTEAAHRGPDLTNLVDTLRNACARATTPIHPLFVRIKLYQAVISLTRGLMLARADAGLSPVLDADLVMLLDDTRESAGAMAIDPELPVMDAILLYNLIARLCRLAHRARGKRAAQPAPDKGKPSSTVPTPIQISAPPVVPSKPDQPADGTPVLVPVWPSRQRNAGMTTEAGHSPQALERE